MHQRATRRPSRPRRQKRLHQRPLPIRQIRRIPPHCRHTQNFKKRPRNPLFQNTFLRAIEIRPGAYYWCQELAKKGNFTESGCQTVAEKNGEADHKGNWELQPVTACAEQKKGEYTSGSCTTKSAKAKKGTFEITTGRGYTSEGGPAALSIPAFGEGKVECKASTDVGEITSDDTTMDRMTFTGCEFEGLPCESAGANSTPSGKSGVIITNGLAGKLISNPETLTWLDAESNEVVTRGPAVGEVWNELSGSEHEPYSSEFNCGGVVFLRTQGQLAGVYEASSLNRLTSTSETAFEATKGAQGLLAEVLTEAGWLGPAPSIEEAGVITTTY